MLWSTSYCTINVQQRVRFRQYISLPDPNNHSLFDHKIQWYYADPYILRNTNYFQQSLAWYLSQNDWPSSLRYLQEALLRLDQVRSFRQLAIIKAAHFLIKDKQYHFSIELGKALPNNVVC